MVIHKILNNNLILSRDGQGHEVIVKGCGIAFQKKKGQQVEESRIEKIFTAENAQISKEIQGYLTAIPEKYLDFVEAFVNDVKEKEGMKLNDSIYFSLSDHIMGAISRLENGIRLQNMLLLDIKQINEQEHVKLTGQTNTNILAMARELSDMGKPVWIRHVLVPGGSDKDEYLHQLADFIHTLKNVERVEVLPYHTLGIFKWEKLGIPYPLEGVKPPTQERIDNARRILGAI